MSSRVLWCALLALLAVALFWSPRASANVEGCTGSTPTFSCDTRSHAHAQIQSVLNIDDATFCSTYYGLAPGTAFENNIPPASVGAQGLLEEHYTCAGGMDIVVIGAGYWTDDACKAGITYSTQDYWGTQISDLPATGSTACEPDSCSATMTPNAKPDWEMSYQQWHEQFTGTQTGASCSYSGGAGAIGDGGQPPPTKPPDSDGDGIPDGQDSFPGDPGNTPPPPPPPTVPPTKPPPPTGDGGATGADIGALTQTLDSDFTALGNKIDTLQASLSAIKVGADQNAVTIAGAISALGAQIGGLAGSIVTLGGGGGTTIDLGPTNAILTGIHSDTTGMHTDTTGIHTDTSGIATSAAHIDQALTNTSGVLDHKDTLTEPSAGEGDAGWASDASSGSGDSSSFDDSGFGWSRACPASPTVSVFGKTLTLDASPMCTWLGLGGLLVLALSSLACIRILAGAAR